MNIEKKKNFIISFLFYALILCLVFLFFKYAAVWLAPFLIGFGIAILLKPAVNFISEKINCKRRFAATACILFIYALLALVIWLLAARGILELIALFEKLPVLYNESLLPSFRKIGLAVSQFLLSVSPSLYEQFRALTADLSPLLASFGETLSQLFLSLLKMLTSSLPNLVIALVFTVVSSVFISLDYNKITGFIMRQIPQKYHPAFFENKDYFFNTLLKMLRAYLILMAITFLELGVGFTVLRIEYAFTIAALIALLDFLPFIGTGAAMIPWIAVEAIRGNFSLAAGLAVIYCAVSIIRNLIEPKIVGRQIGLHPLLTLLAIYLGLKLFGVTGVLIGPLLLIIFKNLNDTGKIKWIK